ncbi:hypothetical protein CXF54_14400 [Olleya sp. 1-3]|nr:hypothetical protein CXF54_14400 [Olleya sp. 1-3]
MGGEGAMMAANQSLKSNRSMMAKRKEKSFSFVTNSTEKTEYNLPEATEEDLVKLRNKLKKYNRYNTFKSIVILIVTFLLLLFFFISIS